MKPQESCDQITVLYDGNCPLCRREIAHLQGLAARQEQSSLCFVDIKAPLLYDPVESQKMGEKVKTACPQGYW